MLSWDGDVSLFVFSSLHKISAEIVSCLLSRFRRIRLQTLESIYKYNVALVTLQAPRHKYLSIFFYLINRLT